MSYIYSSISYIALSTKCLLTQLNEKEKKKKQPETKQDKKKTALAFCKHETLGIK